jgi:hypothetical protein
MNVVMQNKGCGSEEERSKSVWQTIHNPQAQDSMWDGSMKAAVRGELGSKFVGGEQSQNEEGHADR